MGLPLRRPVAKLSCEAATEENAKRRSSMPRTQVTGKANFSPGTSFQLTGGSEPEVRRNNFSAEGVYCKYANPFHSGSSLSVDTSCV